MIRVRASQIFTNAVDDAVAAKKLLDAGGTFLEAVEKYSTCPSKKNGGDLGWMPEESATALMGEITEKDKGKTLGPIHSEYGYHILMITDIEVQEDPVSFNPDTPMTEVNRVLPEAHTLLFKKLHIGMPVSGYKPEETIFTVSEQHGKQVGEVLSLLNKELSDNLSPMISPEDLKVRIESGDTQLVLLDIREQWECDISKIEGATRISPDNSDSVLAKVDQGKEIVLIDWKGDRSPSFQKWLTQRGYKNVKGLEGGIDAWAEKVNTHLSRYDIDQEDDDYRYDDIFDEPSE